jgi:hypothetical protein
MDQVVAISKRSASSLDTVAGHAQRVYSIAEGAMPPPRIEEVSSSWQRSAKKYGVDPVDSKAPRILTPGELKDFREPLEKPISSAQEEIDQLYKVVRKAGYAVVQSHHDFDPTKLAVLAARMAIVADASNRLKMLFQAVV